MLSLARRGLTRVPAASRSRSSNFTRCLSTAEAIRHDEALESAFKRPPPVADAPKSSITMELRDKPGALHEVRHNFGKLQLASTFRSSALTLCATPQYRSLSTSGSMTSTSLGLRAAQRSAASSPLSFSWTLMASVARYALLLTLCGNSVSSAINYIRTFRLHA
jgi:hypothetical protein